MLALNEEQIDTIAEFMNMGMGVAAASLSQLLKDEIILSVPVVNLVNRDSAIDMIGARTNVQIAAVREKFYGPFWGDALVIFEEEKSLDLIRRINSGLNVPDALAHVQQETLVEVGNIILNACLGTLANILNEEIKTFVPAYEKGTLTKILKANPKKDNNDEAILLLKMFFSIKTENIDGFVTLVMDIDSVKVFLDRVNLFLKNL